MVYFSFGLNMLFSLGCACLALFATDGVVSEYLPLQPPFIRAVGLGLLVFSTCIGFVLVRGPKLLWCLAITGMDVLWIVGTSLAALVFAEALGATGVRVVMGINVVIMVFTILQYASLFTLVRHPDSASGFDTYIRSEYAVRSSRDVFWGRLSRLGDIHLYASGVESSEMINGDSGVGAIRRCTDGKEGTWTEEVVQWDEGEGFALKFDPSAPGFPFPVTRLNGGWSLLTGASGDARVVVWFEFACKDHRTKLLSPLLGALWMISFGRVVEALDKGRVHGGAV